MKLETKLLKTNRLILRKIYKKDYKLLYDNIYSDPLIYKYNFLMKKIENYSQMKKEIETHINNYKQNKALTWVVTKIDNKKPIGVIIIYYINKTDLSAHIAYFYGSKYYSKGYATESIKEVLNYCKQKLKIIKATTLEENNRSIKLLEKLNFKKIKNEYGTIYYELKL